MKTLEVGRIVRPHGLRGETKVQLHWSASSALRVVTAVIVRRPGEVDRPYPIERVRGEGRATLLKLVGVDTPDQAESLRGATVHVRADALPPLAPGEYYLSDLVGAQVFVGSEEVGTVVEVRPYPTVDVMVIENAEGRRFEQPIVDYWLEHVDVGRGHVRLVSKDGLVD